MDKIFTYEGLRLHYTDKGEGQAVVLLHGWGCDCNIFGAAKAWAEEHFRTIAVDFAGFGRMIFAYPDFAKDIIKQGALDKSKICICCSKCTNVMRAGSTPGCVIRDKEVYLPLFEQYCGGNKK